MSSVKKVSDVSQNVLFHNYRQGKRFVLKNRITGNSNKSNIKRNKFGKPIKCAEFVGIVHDLAFGKAFLWKGKICMCKHWEKHWALFPNIQRSVLVEKWKWQIYTWSWHNIIIAERIKQLIIILNPKKNKY